MCDSKLQNKSQPEQSTGNAKLDDCIELRRSENEIKVANKYETYIDSY